MEKNYGGFAIRKRQMKMLFTYSRVLWIYLKLLKECFSVSLSKAINFLMKSKARDLELFLHSTTQETELNCGNLCSATRTQKKEKLRKTCKVPGAILMLNSYFFNCITSRPKSLSTESTN